eukprot:gene11338-33639_t
MKFGSSSKKSMLGFIPYVRGAFEAFVGFTLLTEPGALHDGYVRQDKDVLKLDLFKNVASIAWLYMIGTGAVGKIPLGDAKLANWTIVPITAHLTFAAFEAFMVFTAPKGKGSKKGK